MRIGIDFTSASRERAGIGRYARELIRALVQVDAANRYLLFVPSDAQPDLLTYAWGTNFTIKHGPLNERYLAALWQRARVPLPIESFIGACEVLYSPDFLLPPTRAKRKLVTVHDLSYMRLPECFPKPLLNYLNNAVPRSLDRADLILADADSTRRDLSELCKIPPGKIRTLYSGVDARFRPDVPEESKAHIQTLTRGRPYLLAVGTLQPRKNYVRLIEALSRLVTDRQLPFANLQLVIAGSRGWMFQDILAAPERYGIRDRVIFPDYVADADLPALYAGATLFVFPSLYEGFGLPIAEAMACGTPVVTSNAASLPEVAGDAALYFDPRDVDAMATQILHALSDDALRTDLRGKGFVQALNFSWDKAAIELLGYLTDR